MQITFDLSKCIGGRSNATLNSYTLKSLLDCLVRVNLAYLRLNKTSVPRLYQSGVRYGRTQVWEAIPALYGRGYGDCKSLTAALVAEYRVRGIKAFPVFRSDPNKLGGNDYHILVCTPFENGLDHKQFEDPSKKLGMGRNEVTRYVRSW